MIHYYDRQGQPISVLGWQKRLGDPAYNHVADTTLPNGQWVSTVWLGLNHEYGVAEAFNGLDSVSTNGPPLIFETMVFPSRNNFTALDAERYGTEAEARAGHQALCDKWTKEPHD